MGSPSVDYNNGSVSTTVNQPANAFDGNLETYYASYARSYTWVGLDLATPHVITRVGWSPRNDGKGPERVKLGIIEGANRADFLDAVPLYVIDQAGVIGQMHYADVHVSKGFRYVRYVGPNDARCNIAELAFYGQPGEGDETQFYLPSGLPLVVINTVDAVEPYDKVNDIGCYVRIINTDHSFVMDSATTRLRGNASTQFPKKPYRIKLGSKAALLGMNKSKHFALLAHADDNLGFYRNTLGFEFSRLMGMPYTPAQEPVEVVLNGNYIGLYFLTETVRIDEDRVNIVEQEDYATDASEITGGWLVEIDNYDEAEQVRITEGNGVTMRFTYKTPELLSAEQRRFLSDQMNAIDDAIYLSDKSSTDWEELVDMDRLVRFYIVQEIMQNAESFHGSCYMHRDRGEDQKWMFGPVWDFGNSFHNGENRFIYINSPFGNHWIEEFAKFPRFQEHVKMVWNKFYREEVASIDAFMTEFADKIAVAAACDYARWPQYGNADIYAKKSEMKKNIDGRIEWLHGHWVDNSVTHVGVSEFEAYAIDGGIVAPENAEIYNLSGCKVSADNLPAGVYIVRLGSQARKILVR